MQISNGSLPRATQIRILAMGAVALAAVLLFIPFTPKVYPQNPPRRCRLAVAWQKAILPGLPYSDRRPSPVGRVILRHMPLTLATRPPPFTSLEKSASQNPI